MVADVASSSTCGLFTIHFRLGSQGITVDILPPKKFSYEDRDLLSVQNVYKFLFTIQVQIALEMVIVLGAKILTL